MHRIAWNAALLSCGLVSGCHSGPGNLTEFEQQLVAASCEHQVGCGRIAESERAACEADGKTYFDTYLPGMSGYALADGEAAGKLEVDGEQADRCIDVFHHDPCALLIFDLFDEPACRAAVVGKVARGAPCQSDLECNAGFCRRSVSTCGGVCAAYAGEGEPCGEAPCDPAIGHCETSGTCTRWSLEGEACPNGNECRRDFPCSEGVCRAPGKVGDDCRFMPCEPTLYCDRTAAPTCREPASAGSSCTTFDSCPIGQTCAMGANAVSTCVPFLDRGSSCVVGASACPYDLPCSPDTGTCDGVGWVRDGAPCGQGGDCSVLSPLRPSLFCDSTTICRNVRSPGSACGNEPNGCATTCDDVTQVCSSVSTCP